MKKSEIISVIAEEVGISKKIATDVIDHLTALAKEQVRLKGEFTLHNLCSFKTKDKPARIARNPRTGESVSVPAKTVVTAKPHGVIKQV